MAKRLSNLKQDTRTSDWSVEGKATGTRDHLINSRVYIIPNLENCERERKQSVGQHVKRHMS